MLNELIKEPFLGFGAEALNFLGKLKNKKYNNKIWFDKNRNIYESYLKNPMKELINDLSLDLKNIDENIIISDKSIFRINRDIRFSKDKTPYKTNYAVGYSYGSIRKTDTSHFYFHITKDEFLFAAGQYSKDPLSIKRIRNKIFRNFDEFMEIINKKLFLASYDKIYGDSLVNLPKEYSGKDIRSEMIPFLKLKQFYVYRTYDPKVILSNELKNIILENTAITNDFNKFLFYKLN